MTVHDESIPILLEWDAVGIQQASKRAEIALNGDLYLYRANASPSMDTFNVS